MPCQGSLISARQTITRSNLLMFLDQEDERINKENEALILLYGNIVLVLCFQILYLLRLLSIQNLVSAKLTLTSKAKLSNILT